MSEALGASLLRRVSILGAVGSGPPPVDGGRRIARLWLPACRQTGGAEEGRSLTGETGGLDAFLEGMRRHAVEACVACGDCFRMCPALEHLDIGDLEPEDVQARIRAFLDGGEASEPVYRRAFSCMGCYGCCAGVCPQGLDPMQMNELVKALYRRRGLDSAAYTPGADPVAQQRVMASIQVTPGDYGRIFTASPQRSARFVFFAGCNVYAQPARLLEALDVLALAGEDVAFLPGLDHCCGDTPLFMGDPEEASRTMDDLVASLSAYEPEAVVFWCATCQCRFHTTVKRSYEVPFATMSLPRFLGERLEHLAFRDPIPARATIHEPCKLALTGLDRAGPRPLLAQIPGLDLVEMPRTGDSAPCCGGGAATWFPATADEIRDERLDEARGTGADTLIDVCHYCHHVFLPEAERFGLVAENWIHVLARSLGVARDDRYADWRRSMDPERVMAEAAETIAASPFPRGTIETVVRAHFGG